MRVLFIDAFSGVSGDKTVASLLSLGIDKKILLDNLSTLKVSEEFNLEFVEKKILALTALNSMLLIKIIKTVKESNMLKAEI